MSRMLDLIRTSQVPSNLMQSAARGALAVPPEEMIEILVYLAHHKLFGEQSKLTLAGWDEKSSKAVAANPNTSPEVLGYLASLENLRIALLPELAENPSVSEESLDALAVSGARPVIEVLLGSARVAKSPKLMQALQTNPAMRPNELSEITKKLSIVESSAATDSDTTAAEGDDEIVRGAVVKFLEENAAELTAEHDKPFKPIGMSLEEEPAIADAIVATTVEATHDAAPEAAAQAVTGDEAKMRAAAAAAMKAKAAQPTASRDSVLQKISKLNIRGRITLAMRGTKEERSILIRDSNKLVAIAVLDSPKISDGEVEKIALQKNVLEAVLRAIQMKRR